MLFWPEISALGVFLNFDNERMRPPKCPSDPPGVYGQDVSDKLAISHEAVYKAG